MTEKRDRLIYIIGQPGSGKSTLMAKLVSKFDTEDHPNAPVPHVLLIDKAAQKTAGIEIGVRRGNFSGTDALAASIVDKAAPMMETGGIGLVLAEGARLANRRFLMSALDGGYDVVLVLLDHADAEAWRKKRSKKLGRTQAAPWVKGRLTASRNLAAQFEKYASAEPYSGHLTVLAGHPDEVEPKLALIDSRLR